MGGAAGATSGRRAAGADLPAVAAQIRSLHEATGTPVSLVGWSRGGIIAREAARMAPDAVRMVVTLGSPFAAPAASNVGAVWRRPGRPRWRRTRSSARPPTSISPRERRKGCVPSLPGGSCRRNGCPLAIPSTRLELGAVRKRKLYRAGNKNLAGPRQVGQSHGEVHGFADGGVASPRSADDDFPDCEAGMHHEVAVKSARQNRHALAQLHRSPWPVYDCWV